MQVFGFWHGGGSYFGGEFREELEMFNSLEEAVTACDSRYTSGHWKPQDFDFLNRDSAAFLTPCVDENATMHVYKSDPSDDFDPYPDYVIQWDESAEKFVAGPA